jgi:hypothetical protein
LAPSDFGAAESGASSTTEFQAPQASQRPAHFVWAAPQAVQLKAGDDFAMRLSCPNPAQAASRQR